MEIYSGAARNDGSQQPLNAAPAVVSLSVSVSSKMEVQPQLLAKIVIYLLML